MNREPTPRPTGYASEPVTQPPQWHGLVAWDILLNNLSSGLFLVAGVGELTVPGALAGVARLAYPVALVLILADLLLLVIDLGDPLRFHHMLRVVKLRSPMSLGVWCLTAYSFLLTVAVVLALVPGEATALEWGRRAVVVLALLPGLGSAVYKGVLFSTSSQPVWKKARWLGAYLSSSALLLGCAELLALSVLMGQEEAMVILRPALELLLVLNVVPLGLLLLDVRAALPSASRRGLLAGFALAGGALLPLALLLLGGSVALLGAVLFLVLGSLLIRLVIVGLPHVPHSWLR